MRSRIVALVLMTWLVAAAAVLGADPICQVCPSPLPTNTYTPDPSATPTIPYSFNVEPLPPPFGPGSWPSEVPLPATDT